MQREDPLSRRGEADKAKHTAEVAARRAQAEASVSVTAGEGITFAAGSCAVGHGSGVHVRVPSLLAAVAERDHYKALVAELQSQVARLTAEQAASRAEREELLRICDELMAKAESRK